MVIFLVWHECSFSLRWACPRGRSWTVTSLIRLFTATLETSDNIFIFVVIFWIVDACKCHTDHFWQLFAIIDDKQFRDPIHGRRPSQLSGGCVCVWGEKGNVYSLDKRAITEQPLWSLSLLPCAVKGGACSCLAGPSPALWVHHLSLNSRPVWRPCVTTSWEGSCFSWWFAGFSRWKMLLWMFRHTSVLTRA